jgi:hypothetical protein
VEPKLFEALLNMLEASEAGDVNESNCRARFVN